MTTIRKGELGEIAAAGLDHQADLVAGLDVEHARSISQPFTAVSNSE